MVALLAAFALFMSAFVFAAPTRADTTVIWTGHGVTNGELDELGNDCEQFPDGYLHWVLTAAGAESATITINGTTSAMEQGGQGRGAFHFYSPWYDLDTVQASATYVGDVPGNVVLTISHGCPAQQVVDEGGMADVQIHKWVCAGDETMTTIEIFGPVGIAAAEDQAPEEGCVRASDPWEFLILDSEGNPVQAYDDEGNPLASIQTGATGTVRVSIETDDDGENFTLVELHPNLDPNPSQEFTLATGELITFRVANYFAGEGELPTGEVKILKSFCGEFEDGLVRFMVNGVFQDELENIDLEPCAGSDAYSFYFDGDTEATFTTTNGLYVETLAEGQHTLTEVETGASVTFMVVAGEETEIEVFNWAPAGEVEMVEVSIMKHLCTDVTTVAEFEAIEAAAAAAFPENPVAPLVATVLACPTIILTADIPSDTGAQAGHVDFEFSVADESGTQLLSSDGTFMDAQLCETDVNLDADGSGTIDADVCLDVSHYSFEVVDGIVTITETAVPAGSSGLGTIRFTPGSGDDAALVGDIGDVESTGVIVLDTTADADGSVMIHAYNFAIADGEGEGPGQPGNGGQLPTEGQLPGQPQPGEGTLPDTATTGSVPAALLALVMLTGLGAAGYAMQAEARRRR